MKILFLADGPRLPMVTGDRLRNWRLIERLATRHPVTWWAMQEPDEPPPGDCPAGVVGVDVRVPARWEDSSGKPWKWMRAPFAADPLLLLTPPHQGTSDRIAREGPAYDVIHCSHLLPWRMVPRPLWKKCVVDLHDSMSMRYEAFLKHHTASGPGDRSLLLCRIFGQAGKLRRYEARMPDMAGAALVVARRDRDYLEAPRMEVVPNGVDCMHYRTRGAGRVPGRIIFFGNLAYRPNADAAELLARELLPRIREKVPEAHLRIVGAHPMPSVSALASLPAVTVVGWVEDLRVEMDQARIFACSLRVASGLQNKVLESLAMELPTVATPTSAAGLELEAGRHLLVAEPGPEFVEAASRLLTDECLRLSLAREGRRVVEENYTWDRAADSLEAIYRRVARREGR